MLLENPYPICSWPWQTLITTGRALATSLTVLTTLVRRMTIDRWVIISPLCMSIIRLDRGTGDKEEVHTPLALAVEAGLASTVKIGGASGPINS